MKKNLNPRRLFSSMASNWCNWRVQSVRLVMFLQIYKPAPLGDTSATRNASGAKSLNIFTWIQILLKRLCDLRTFFAPFLVPSIDIIFKMI